MVQRPLLLSGLVVALLLMFSPLAVLTAFAQTQGGQLDVTATTYFAVRNEATGWVSGTMNCTGTTTNAGTLTLTSQARGSTSTTVTNSGTTLCFLSESDSDASTNGLERQITVASNALTNANGGTIANTNIKVQTNDTIMKFGAKYPTNNNCGVINGTSDGRLTENSIASTALNTATKIIGIAAGSDGCEGYATTWRFNVEIPATAASGRYTNTYTYTLSNV